MEKKILVLNPYLPTLGGGEKYMGYMCKFMEEYFGDDVHIDILTFNYNNIKVTDSDYVTIEKVNQQYDLNLAKTKIRAINQDEIEQNINFEEYLSNITLEYDLFINFMIFSKLVSKAKKSIYLCMFPPVSYELKAVEKSFFEKRKARKRDKCFKDSYDVFAVISRYSIYWFDKFWGKAKTKLVYSPVFSENDLDGRYKESEKKNIILSVGRFFVDAHSKKQLEMVEFFVNNNEVFKDYEFHLAGSVSNSKVDLEYLNTITKVASKVDNIFVHPNIKFDELIELYKKSKIFWHATGYGVDEETQPEKMEHFGITTVEAMSFGTVPVVINKGGQRETVEEGRNGYLWLSEAECVKKTKRIIENDELRKKMAGVSSKEARRFSVEEFYKVNRELFDELQV